MTKRRKRKQQNTAPPQNHYHLTDEMVIRRDGCGATEKRRGALPPLVQRRPKYFLLGSLADGSFFSGVSFWLVDFSDERETSYINLLVVFLAARKFCVGLACNRIPSSDGDAFLGV